MLNFSPEKLLLVGIIALIVLGPHRLPQAARTAGRWVAELRRLSASFQQEVRGAIGEPADAINGMVGSLRPPDVRGAVRNTIGGTFSPSNGSSSNNGAKPAESGPAVPTFAQAPPSAPDDPSLN